MTNTMLSTGAMKNLDNGISKLIAKNCGGSCINCPYASYRFCEGIMVIDKILVSDKETVEMFK